MRKRAWTWAKRGTASLTLAVEVLARVLERSINWEGLKERRDCWVCGQNGIFTRGRRRDLLLHSEMLCEDAAVGEEQGGNAGRSVVKSLPPGIEDWVRKPGAAFARPPGFQPRLSRRKALIALLLSPTDRRRTVG